MRTTISLEDNVSYGLALKIRREKEPLIAQEAGRLRELLKVPPVKEHFASREEKMEYVKNPENLFPTLSEEDRAEIARLKQKIDQMRTNMHHEISKSIKEVMADKESHVQEEIKKLGGQVIKKGPLGTFIVADIPSASLNKLAALSAITFIDSPKEMRPCLNISVPNIGASVFWNGYWYGGSGYYTGGHIPVDAGIIDSGIEVAHPALAGHTIISQYPGIFWSGNPGHGTHVAGIVAGTNATYKGVAYGLDTILNGYGFGAGGPLFALTWLFTQPETPEAINISMIFNTLDDYEIEARYFDEVIEENLVLVVASGGNYMEWDMSPPYPVLYPPTPVDDYIGSPGTCYNGITVGAVDDLNSSYFPDQEIAESSRRGPTIGGRKKPDVVAPGINIKSCNYDWATASDFIDNSGTSMAAPHVTGAVLLLVDCGVDSHLAQKAILINSSVTWTDGGTPFYPEDDHYILDDSQWNPCYGWGSVYLSNAFFDRENYLSYGDPNNDICIYPRSVDEGEKSFQLIRLPIFTDWIKVTLVWERHASSDRLNNLNLDLWMEADNTCIVSSTSTIDNVEQVSPPDLGSDYYENGLIKVYTPDSSFSIADYEGYAVATDQGWWADKISLLSGPDPNTNLVQRDFLNLHTRQIITIGAWIRNWGDCDAHNTTATLDIDAPSGLFTFINCQPSQDLGTITDPNGIDPNYAKYVEWTVRTPWYPGWCPYSVEVTSTSYGESFSAADEGGIISVPYW